MYIEKLFHVLGGELWESKFVEVKEYNYCRCVGNMKTKLYEKD